MRLGLLDSAYARRIGSVPEARTMILRLKAAQILLGARGRKPADVQAAAEAVAALSQFIAANADRYAEIDVNPLIVRAEGDGAVAVDALLVERD